MIGIKKLVVLIAASLAAGAVFAHEADITVFRPAVNPRNKNDPMVRAGTEYTKQTGGKVKYIIADWGNWQSKILSSLAAGEPIDVVFGRDADFPLFYNKGYVQPIDGYVNLDLPYINKVGMDSAFKYNGKYYLASHQTSNHPWLIIYNKSLMEEEGIAEKDQPLALYERGEWTWATLRELAMKLTKDTSGSGKIDRWGFANWWTRGFIYMNGSSFALNQKNGDQMLNFEDPRFMEALDFLAQAKKEGWYMQDNNIAATGLQRRTVAMFMERQYYPANSSLLKDTRDEMAYVPLPKGPGAASSVHIFETDGYGIGMGSQKQKWAGIFIDICLKTWYEDDMRGRREWPQEIFPIAREMSKNPSYFGPLASALDPMIDKMLGEIVWTGNSPSQAIAGWTSQAEILLAEANKPAEKPVRLPFRPIKIDFEDKDISAFKVNGEYKSVKIGTVRGSKAISGTSLLVQMDSAVDGEWIDAILTDPEKLGVSGWRDYRISFDVKPLVAPGNPESAMTFEIFKDTLNKFGFTTQKLEEVGKVYRVSTVVRNISTNGKIPIKIGGHFAGDFVIDNIEIIER